MASGGHSGRHLIHPKMKIRTSGKGRGKEKVRSCEKVNYHSYTSLQYCYVDESSCSEDADEEDDDKDDDDMYHDNPPSGVDFSVTNMMNYASFKEDSSETEEELESGSEDAENEEDIYTKYVISVRGGKSVFFYCCPNSKFHIKIKQKI